MSKDIIKNHDLYEGGIKEGEADQPFRRIGAQKLYEGLSQKIETSLNTTQGSIWLAGFLYTCVILVGIYIIVRGI